MAEATTGKGGFSLGAIAKWPLQRKLAFGAAILVCVTLFAVIILQARVADYKLLYGNLSSVDASAVITKLKDMKIPYRLEDGGASIFIPAEQVYEVRLDLAGSGLPQGSGVGFEIFDKQSFGVTDFTQKINYQRALQGELARSIATLAPVEAARVHLALPAKRLFKEQQDQATASVILKLVQGRQLSEAQTQGIVNLVAGSIEGLNAENVNIVDSSGRILSKGPSQEPSGPMTPGMLDYQAALEKRLEERAQSLLDRALGMGNAQVRVTSVVDFSQQEMTQEQFDPDATVVRSEQTSDEKGGSNVASGIPGAETNLGGAAASSTTVPAVRAEKTINYEVSKIVTKKVLPTGTLKQLSVAVLVSDKVIAASEGKEARTEPRTAEELKAIESMIRSALGIESARGDQLEVVSMPFENIFQQEPMAEPVATRDIYQWLPYVKYGLTALGALLLYLLLLRPIVKTMKGEGELESRPMKTVEEMQKSLEGAKALPPKQEDPLVLIRQQAIQQNSAFAQIVKGWLKEG